MVRAVPPGFVLVTVLLILAGCDSRQPYLRTDVWQPTGANAANLAAQVANPRDLIAGRSDARQSANAPVAAVGHIWADQPKPLGGGGSGGGGAGSAGGAGGGASGG